MNMPRFGCLGVSGGRGQRRLRLLTTLGKAGLSKPAQKCTLGDAAFEEARSFIGRALHHHGRSDGDQEGQSQPPAGDPPG